MTTENNIVIKVEELSKQYRLGMIGTGTLSHDLNRWWAALRGKEDPYLKIGEVNRRNQVGDEGTGNYVWALKDINFEVPQGEVLGIIGKNGAGKSTLLKILSRVTGPTTGVVKAKGRVASLLEVGTGFHPELSGKENIYLNGAILGMTKAEIGSKIGEIVEFSGVQKYINTPVKRYSSGMYVRLAFAVAAHLEPEILIIDEVLAVGDIEFQKKCLGKMKDIAGQGRTVLFVSHNMSAVRQLCGDAILLEDGMIKHRGSADDVVDEYLRNVNVNENESFVAFDRNTEKEFQVLSAALVNKTGEKTQHYECDEEIAIQLKCEVFQKVAGMNGCLVINKPDGTVVLFSDSFDTQPNPVDELTVGEHTVTIKLPQRMLAPGTYTITMTFGSVQSMGARYQEVLESILTFHLRDSTSKRGDKRKGFFSTLLEWDVDKSMP